MGSHGLTCPKMRLSTKIWACLGLIVAHIDLRQAKLSDQRLCADPNCSVLVGVGKTVLKYFASEDGMLSFANNKPVKIFSKGAGSNPDLWGVMIDGRRGYANKAHIQEQRVYRKDLVHTVPTEAAGAGSVPFTTQEEGQEKENAAEEKTEEVKVEPLSIQEETHKQLEELKTRQPAEDAGVPEVMASFPGDASLPSSSLPASHLSTPPIAPSASQPPSPPKSNSPEQPVQPEASQDFEVIDGTTIYMDGSAPKINVAPSLDNTTPEAIKPTVTEQAAAEPTIAVDLPFTDDLVEIEGSVGEQNLAVEEVASPSLVPPLHSPPATQQPIAGEEEVKIQEATQLDEHQARVEVPVPNTQVYEPPPEPSLDSDAINAARVQDVHEVEEEDHEDDESDEVADYEDFEEHTDSKEVEDFGVKEQSEEELEKNEAKIEEIRAKHVEEEQARVQEKIKAVMAEIEAKTAAEMEERKEETDIKEGEEINIDEVEEPEPFSVEPMTTPPPPIAEEAENIVAPPVMEQPLKTEDGQVQPDSQTIEPVADAGVVHNQLEQEVHVGDHHAVHNKDHMLQLDRGSQGH